MPRDSLDGWGRRLVHAVVLVAGWVLFFYWWWEVAIRDWDKTEIALIILVTLIVAPVITAWWVLHNIGIFRRKGPRLGVPRVPVEYPRDWNGRTVDADWERLNDARLIVVTVEDDRKLYARGSPDAASRET
jgi:hypothetical protein